MKRSTKNLLVLPAMLAFGLALPVVLAGCEHEISRTTDTTVKSNGSVKSKETVVRQSPDGTVTKEETKSTRNAAPNP